MVEKLVERKKRESDAIKGKKTVSVDELALQSGGAIKVEKKGGAQSQFP